MDHSLCCMELFFGGDSSSVIVEQMHWNFCFVRTGSGKQMADVEGLFLIAATIATSRTLPSPASGQECRDQRLSRE